MNSDSTEATDCENYMFSVTAASDVHTAIMSSCDTAQEAGLFKGVELVYSTEDSTGHFHSNKTGYSWTVSQLPMMAV